MSSSSSSSNKKQSKNAEAAISKTSFSLMGYIDEIKSELMDIFSAVRNEYLESLAKSPRLAYIDALIILSMFTAASQVLYLLCVGSFPFNSFLSGLLSCVGTYAFAVSLRMRITSEEFKGNVTEKQAFAEFVMCSLVMYFMVACFLG